MPSDIGQPARLRLWAVRVLWFVALWCCGLGAVGSLAYVLRLWIAPK